MVYRCFNVGLLWLLVTSSVAASEFFAATVPVADRSETALQSAASDALGEVLIRISGDDAILSNPVIAEVMPSASRNTALYSYAATAEGPAVYVRFEEAWVKSVLADASVPFWTASRPPVVLWMVLDEPSGRRFADTTFDGALIQPLVDGFKARGVQLRLPLHDLSDAAAISPDAVWSRNQIAIEAASQRYDGRHILVARLIQLSSGEWLADWSYTSEQDQINRQSQGSDPSLVAAVAVDMSVDAMAAQYAVYLDASSQGVGVPLMVSGVESVDDFEAVMRTLAQVDVINKLRIEGVDGDELLLRATGIADTEALSRSLAELPAISVLESDDARLNVRWTRL